MALFLTHGADGETADLTGAKKRPRHIEALVRNGIRFFVGADGWPRVPRAEIERHDHGRESEPDFASMRARR
jgi:hypothetical protein